MENSSNYLEEVRDQYEDLPYPPRDPKHEKERLVQTDLDILETINHVGFGGTQTFRDGFKCLVAGGGTGDSTIHLAQQLKGFEGATVTQVDLSSASLEIAKQRAEVRGLTNIEFIHGSLLDVAKLNLGKFDYINCCGVLHHLENPDDGLKALSSVLKDDGLIGIMVYAKYGRLSIYPLQRLFRLVNTNAENKNEKLKNAKAILEKLPDNHFANSPQPLWKREYDSLGDEGLFDAVLHPQDVAYSVTDAYNWVERCELNIEMMYGQRDERSMYEPNHYISSPELREEIKGFPLRERQEIAEIINGNILRHTFFVNKKANTTASTKNKSLVPFFFPELGMEQTLATGIENHIPLGHIKITGVNSRIMLPASKEGAAIVSNIDGKNDIKTILNRAEKKLKKSGIKTNKSALEKVFEEYYRLFNNADGMLLRSKEVGELRTKESLLKHAEDTRKFRESQARING